MREFIGLRNGLSAGIRIGVLALGLGFAGVCLAIEAVQSAETKMTASLDPGIAQDLAEAAAAQSALNVAQSVTSSANVDQMIKNTEPQSSSAQVKNIAERAKTPTISKPTTPEIKKAKEKKRIKRANRVVAAVNDEIITSREVELYRAGRLFSGLNPKLALEGNDLSYRAALNELIDIKLELQMARSNASEDQWEGMKKRMLLDYAKSAGITVENFVKDASKQFNLSEEETAKNISETMILQRGRQETFGDEAMKASFSDSQIAKTREQMRKLFVPTIPYVTAKDKQYTLAETEEKAQTSDANKDVLAKQAAKQMATDQRQELFAQISKLYKKPALLAEYLKQHPEVKVQDYEWNEIMVTELPDLFVETVSKLKPGETAAPILAPNGIHTVTLVALERREVPADMLQAGDMPDISKERAVSLLRRCKIHSLARERIEKEVRPQSYVRIFDRSGKFDK